MAALAGVVVDTMGHTISGATLTRDSTTLFAVTNDSGRFFLSGVPAGKSFFTLARLGYLAVHFQADLAADSTLVLRIPMRSVQTLPDVVVKAEPISAKLLRVGYYERKQRGLGSFVGPDKVEKLAWATLPSTMLRDVRGIRVRCGSRGIATQRCTVTAGTGCVPTVYVNRVKVSGQLDEVVSPSEVYAIEVYEREAVVPFEFMPSRCVVAIWTKTFAQ